jgi:CDP-diacylglycerol--serine O-phosphatidyltransferase
LTTANLLCGFGAILLTLDGRYVLAAVALFAGMLMDILDGKVARLTRTTTQFGVEYDSLADMVSFGLAPALLMYAWALSHLWDVGRGAGRIGVGAAFLFVLCAALRLARFNVLTGISDRRYFVGLPSPGAAGAVAAIVVAFPDAELERIQLVVLTGTMCLLAFLMISNIRYYSFKELDFAKRHPFGVLLVVTLGSVIAYAMGETFPFVAFSAYALSGPARLAVLKKREPVPPVVLREPGRGPQPPTET